MDALNLLFPAMDQEFEPAGAAEFNRARERALRLLGCKNRLLTSLRASIGYRSFGRKFASAASRAGL